MSQQLMYAGHPVDLVIVDAMFTLFSPRKKTKWKMIVDIYRFHGHLPENVTDQTIQDKIQEVRARITPLAKSICRNTCDRWIITNMIILSELGVALPWAAARGRDINIRILQDLNLYVIDKPMRKFIDQVNKSNARIVIGSDQRRSYLTRHLRHHTRFDSNFDEFYVSQDLRVNKPAPKFWKRILARERSAGFPTKPSRVIHIGNSANTDVGAAEIGIQTLLIDRYGELSEFAQGKLTPQVMPDHTDLERLAQLVQQGLIKVVNLDELKNMFTLVELDEAQRA